MIKRLLNYLLKRKRLKFKCDFYECSNNKKGFCKRDEIKILRLNKGIVCENSDGNTIEFMTMTINPKIGELNELANIEFKIIKEKK